jgi:hypothetical protein
MRDAHQSGSSVVVGRRHVSYSINHLQRELQKDLGDYSNIKNYLTTRLTPMTPTQIKYLHKTRLYYDQSVGSSTQAQRIEDVHRSRHIHMRGMLTGLSNGVKHYLPPQQSLDFKFTKASPRFYMMREDGNTQEYKVGRRRRRRRRRCTPSSIAAGRDRQRRPDRQARGDVAGGG